jgi:ribonuclease HIII
MGDRLAERLAEFDRLLAEKGWQVLERRDIEHGIQLVVTDGATQLPVNFYHTGKMLVQGAAGSLREALLEWVNLQQTGAGAAGDVRIGVDESGKGDVFGPLVVAAARVTPEVERALARRGVRDSKTLADVQIAELAGLIRAQCEYEVLELRPPEYNAAYERFGRNLNRLLAWGHARVIAALHARAPAVRAISDQFGNARLVADALRAEGCAIALEQRPRAESDLAVAAASVLARAAFIAAMDEFAARAGMTIPRGASAPEVKVALRRIHARWGMRGLERIAKMHFKTVRDVLAEQAGNAEG